MFSLFYPHMSVERNSTLGEDENNESMHRAVSRISEFAQGNKTEMSNSL